MSCVWPISLWSCLVSRARATMTEGDTGGGWTRTPWRQGQEITGHHGLGLFHEQCKKIIVIMLHQTEYFLSLWAETNDYWYVFYISICATVWGHCRPSCLCSEQENINSLFYDTSPILSINTWGQHWVAAECPDPLPLLDGPQRGAHSLSAGSVLHLPPHAATLTGIHNKMSRGSCSMGGN